MKDPAMFNHSFGVSFLALLQLMVPAVVAVACLYGVSVAFGVPRTGDTDELAAFAAVLLLLLPRQTRNAETAIFGGRVSVVYGVLLRWAATLGILLAIAFTIKVTEIYSRRVVGAWVVLSAVLM